MGEHILSVRESKDDTWVLRIVHQGSRLRWLPLLHTIVTSRVHNRPSQPLLVLMAPPMPSTMDKVCRESTSSSLPATFMEIPTIHLGMHIIKFPIEPFRHFFHHRNGTRITNYNGAPEHYSLL